MSNKPIKDAPQETCRKCGKRIVKERRAGSLTSYLFGALDCRCGLKTDSNNEFMPAYDDGSEFCPKCGLKIGRGSAGSITAFLFQSTRCKCAAPVALDTHTMNAKFWNLRRSGSDTIFAPVAGGDANAQNQRKLSQAQVGLAEGAIIGGVYRVIKLIGRGGMGEVYLVRHELLDKKCALKVIPPSQVTEEGWRRFQLEARAIAGIEHENLVQVTDLGIHDGCLPFYAMEYVEGKNLAELLAERGTLPPKMVIQIFMQVCDAVERVHNRGLLHRDIKPGNIMVCDLPGQKQKVKVLDFGLAKVTRQRLDDQSVTVAGDVFGSPFYMSPEQGQGEKVDNRSDIYSIGCTMFECLTGRPPFSANMAAAVIFSHMESPPPTIASVLGSNAAGEQLEVIMAGMLRKRPSERYQSAGQLKADLERALAGKTVLPVFESRAFTEPRRRADDVPITAGNPRKQGERLVALFAAGGILVVILAGIFLVRFVISAQVPSPKLNAGDLVFDKGEELIDGAKADAESRKRNQRVDQPEIPPEKPGKFIWDRQPFCKRTTSNGKNVYAWFVPARPGNAEPFLLQDDGFDLVRIPRGVMLLYPKVTLVVPQSGLLANPAAFAGFEDGTFGGISFQSPQDARLSLTCAAEFKKFPSLYLLRFFGPAWSVKDCREIVPVVDILPNLTKLVLEIPLDKAALSEMHCWHKLTWLTLGAVEGYSRCDYGDILRRCPHLETLELRDDVAFVHKPEIVLGLNSLEMLYLGSAHASHAQMRVLAQLPHLKALNVPRLLRRPDLISDLRAIKHLQSIEFSRQYCNLSPADFAEMHRALPTLKIWGTEDTLAAQQARRQSKSSE